MLGAIVGDICGSRFEGALFLKGPFNFRSEQSSFTDDTVLTCAVMDTLLNQVDAAEALKSWWRRYPGRHYGGWFTNWAASEETAAYGSYANGGAMRIGPVALFSPSGPEAGALAARLAAVTHDSEEGMRGAAAIGEAAWMAWNGRSKKEIRTTITGKYYRLDRTVADYVNHQVFEMRCDDTVPKAITAALEADCFEDVMVNAALIGGDVDTIACMAGSIGEGLYGIPPSLGVFAWERLGTTIQDLVSATYRQVGFTVEFSGKEKKRTVSRANLRLRDYLKVLKR